MRFQLFVALSALTINVTAQEVFEPVDFNVTEALRSNGVNVSALPDLAELNEKRSIFSPYAAAVRHPTKFLHVPR